METEDDLYDNKIEELRKLLQNMNISLTNKEEECAHYVRLLLDSLNAQTELRKKLLVSEGNLIINTESCYAIKQLFDFNVMPEIRSIWVAELEKKYSNMMEKHDYFMSCISLDSIAAGVNQKTMINTSCLSKYIQNMCYRIKSEAEEYKIILNTPQNENLENTD